MRLPLLDSCPRFITAISGGLPCLIFALVAGLPSCGPKAVDKAGLTVTSGVQPLFQVGSLSVFQSDLDQQLKEQHSGRNDQAAKVKALNELASRAQFVQAALDAQTQTDPVVRAEIARLLASRYRELTLAPQLKALPAKVPETRLREIYKANEARYQSKEKREVAVLWLDPGADPQRQNQYREKMQAALDWYLKSSGLEGHPERGFDVLGVDYSEHQASRYKAGVYGWIEREGGMDAWTKALAEIAFSLAKPGDVSAVVVRQEGVFLVRYMTAKPELLRPFESVAPELEKGELSRLKQKAEADFKDALAAKYPVQRLVSPAPAKPSVANGPSH